MPEFRQPKRQAAFRGVKFYYNNSGDSGGKRIVTHEYPGRDDHYNEELGLSPNKYDISGYLLSPDLEKQERELKAVLQVEGAGSLYHPALDLVILCRPLTWTFSPSKDSLGRRDFTVNFVEEGEQPSPIAVGSAKPTILSKLKAFSKTLIDDVNRLFSIVGATTKAINDTVDGVRRSIESIKNAFYSNFTLALADVSSVVDNVLSSAETIVSSGQLDKVADLVSVLAEKYNSNTGTASAKKIAALQQITQLQIDYPNTGSFQNKLVRNNLKQVQFAIQRQALIELANAIINTNYDNSTEAHVARNDFVTRAIAIQQAASKLNQIDSYTVISELSALVGQQLSSLTDNLKPVAIKTTPIIRTSLSLAWELYQDPTMASDLINRNNVGNGSFVPTSIKYLTDARLSNS